MESGWDWDESRKAVFWYLVKKKEIDKFELRWGPPVGLDGRVKDFKKVHKKTFVKQALLLPLPIIIPLALARWWFRVRDADPVEEKAPAWVVTLAFVVGAYFLGGMIARLGACPGGVEPVPVCIMGAARFGAIGGVFAPLAVLSILGLFITPRTKQPVATGVASATDGIAGEAFENTEGPEPLLSALPCDESAQSFELLARALVRRIWVIWILGFGVLAATNALACKRGVSLLSVSKDPGCFKTASWSVLWFGIVWALPVMVGLLILAWLIGRIRPLASKLARLLARLEFRWRLPIGMLSALWVGIILCVLGDWVLPGAFSPGAVMFNYLIL